MGEHPVLDDEVRHGCFGMLYEQRVVADAQADDYVQVGLPGVEYLRLNDWVAQGLMAARVHLDVLGYSDAGLVDSAHLAHDGAHALEPLRLEDLREQLRFAAKAHACSDADSLRADLLREQRDFLHARQRAVVQSLAFGGSSEHLARHRVVAVLLQCLVEELLGVVRRHAEIGPIAVQVVAVILSAVHA